MKIPISCAIPPGEARSQLREWKALRRLVNRAERVSPNRLELNLLPEADIASIAVLAQKEKACCPFFSFTIEISDDHLALVVEVPDDAIEVLDDLASSSP